GRPRAGAAVELHAMAGAAFLADDAAGVLELTRQALIRAHDLIERIGHLAGEPRLVAGQSDGEVAVAHRLQRSQDLAQIKGISFRARRAVRLAALGLGSLLL